MKTINLKIGIALIICFLSFEGSANWTSPDQEETPCMKCLKTIQAAHLSCLATAGNDENEKSKCNKKLAVDNENCQKGACKQ